jgi:hypothetical protein
MPSCSSSTATAAATGRWVSADRGDDEAGADQASGTEADRGIVIGSVDSQMTRLWAGGRRR